MRIGGATMELTVAPLHRAASKYVEALNRGTTAIDPPVTNGGAQRYSCPLVWNNGEHR
jgi:hypothetical protein